MPLPRSFPPADEGADLRTAIALTPVDGALPVVSWLGPTRGAETGELTEADGFSVVEHGPGMPLLGEHARGRFTRPHLRGHRLRSADVAETGGAWSTWFRPVAEEHDDRRLVVTAVDEHAGLGLVVELETVAGGSLRGRCTVTNRGQGDYVVDGLEVVLPLPDDHVELLDFTGRHERERSPQRHTITDGLWLREGLRRTPRSGLGHHGRRRHPRLRDDPRSRRRRARRLERQLGAAGGAHRRQRHHHRRRRAPAARRGDAAAGGVVRHPVGLLRGGRRRARRAGRGLAHLPALPRRPPAHPAGGAQRLGGGLLRPRPRPAARASPTGPPGSASSGSCSTTVGSTTGATTPPASATGGSTRVSGPTG